MPITSVRVFARRSGGHDNILDSANLVMLTVSNIQSGGRTTSMFVNPRTILSSELHRAGSNTWRFVIVVELAHRVPLHFVTKTFLVKSKEKTGYQDESEKQIKKDWERECRQYKQITNHNLEAPLHSETRDRLPLKAFGRVFLRTDTELDALKVSAKFNNDITVRYVCEQPNIPALLKIINRRPPKHTGGRRRANGFRSAEEDFVWACGFCYFARKKKSTVRSHVEQRVCKKGRERREIRNKEANKVLSDCCLHQDQ
ncbi:uncharacterized protein LOC116615681 isoform X2 [Nematostella vectensis]|uniref:uncharacterized protein LOC116615681 isoform X2 n=1 Tax=Nematostella vectensis TaxID=45351 RepID=UPI001390480A|nr:uncharacterized protein LOC116615681 isoform X2 [Nematostella vectensis]